MEADLKHSPIKVALLIPNAGFTLPEAYINRLLFAHHLGRLDGENPGRYEFYWENVGRVLTPLARERLSEIAIAINADFMLQIDDDMTVPIDLFERLLDTMLSHSADIVGALAFMRHEPHYPVIYTTREGYDNLTQRPYFTREAVKAYPKDSIVECDAIGFGAALVRMSLLRKMSKPWFMSTTGAGEDIWFCRCAKQEANAKILVDTRVKLGHLGVPPVIDEKIYEEYNQVGAYRKIFGPNGNSKEAVNASR